MFKRMKKKDVVIDAVLGLAVGAVFGLMFVQIVLKLTFLQL
jgi:ABC-type thiamin/hydroxymethylpyrimidine transport system permease subunit